MISLKILMSCLSVNFETKVASIYGLPKTASDIIDILNELYNIELTVKLAKDTPFSINLYMGW